MKKNRGSVSVFFAVVLVTLIVFTMSVVEVTRYQIMQLQAQEILISATQSVLAGYDSALKNEYGLFARNPAYSDCDFTVPANRELTGSGYSKDLEYYLRENLETTPLELLNLDGANGFSLSSAEGRAYAKRDMVAYMALRLPLIGFEQVADMYDIAEKMGKTTKFIGDKNQLISEAEDMNDLMADLYLTLDGVLVDKTNQACQMENIYFVNRLFVTDEANLDHVPESMGRQEALDGVDSLSEAVLAYESIQNQIRGIGPMNDDFIEVYDRLQVLYDKRSDLEADIEDVEDDLDDVGDDIDDERDDIREGKGSSCRLSRLKSKRRSLNSKLRDLRRDQEAVEALIREDEATLAVLENFLEARLEAIDASQVTMDKALDLIKASVIGETSVLAHVQSALVKVIQIQGKAEMLSGDIDLFLAESEQEADAYMVSAYENSVEDLEAIKSGYGAGGEDYYDTANNLLLIRSLLEADQTCLAAVKDSGQKVTSNYNYLLANLFSAEGMDQTSLDRLIDLTDLSVTFNKDHLYYGTWSRPEGQNQVVLWLETFDKGIKEFQQVPYMNYDQYETVTGRQGTDMLALYRNLKDLSEKYRLAVVFAGLDLESSKPLPNGLYSDGLMLSDFAGASKAADGEAYITVGGQMASLTETAGNVKDLLLMNEYAVGMFRSYPDQFRNHPETLAGYSKLDHPFTAELAYIYTGDKDPKKALSKVAGQIVALRIGANLIHLASDGAKRATIAKIARQLSGWWAGPVGSVLASLLICLAWASLESFVDLEKLIKGEKVALIKTACTWYTDLNGLERLLTEGLSEFAGNAVTNGIEYASETLQSKSKELIRQVGDDSKDLVEEGLDQMIKRGQQLKGLTVDELDREINRSLDEVLDSYREGRVDVGEAIEPNSPAYSLSMTMKQALEKQLSGADEPTYMDLVLAKEVVLEAYEKELAVARKKVEGEIDSVIDQKVQASIEAIEKAIEEAEEKGTDQVKAAIENAIKLEEEKQVEAVMEAGHLEAVPESELKAALMPEIGYEMYLRLLMVMDSKGADDRLIRMLDLIDYNLAVSRAGSVEKLKADQLIIGEYLVAVGGTMEVALPYLFLDLDMSRMKKEGIRGYHIRSEVVNYYD